MLTPKAEVKYRVLALILEKQATHISRQRMTVRSQQQKKTEKEARENKMERSECVQVPIADKN